MSFRPAALPPRTKCRHPAAYYTTDNNGSQTLIIRISAQLAHSARIKARDAARLFIGTDAHTGMLRLTPVQTSSHHWGQRVGNGSLYLVMPHTGDLAALLPPAPSIQPLEVLEISREDGLTLAPYKPQPAPAQ